MAVALAACAVAPATSHGAWETLRIAGNDREFAPGDHIRLIGHSWFGPISNCKNRVAITLTDAGGKKHKLGEIGNPPRPTFGIGSQNPQNFWDIEGSVRVPTGGIKPGPASLLAIQRIKFRLLVGRCIQIARKQSRLSGITILGVQGNDAPVVSDLFAFDMRQAQNSTIGWRQSEPGQTVVKLVYLFTPQVPLDVATLVDEQRPAGVNTVDWNATLGGRAVPTGRYRVSVQVRDADGSLSDVAQTDFTVGFG